MAKTGSTIVSFVAGALLAGACMPATSYAQAVEASASSPETAAVDVQSAQPLNEDELEILVARIALYPDELIAVITAASLYPLQIVEAERFLEEAKTDTTRKPKPTWDGSVISLLNYPQIIAMMSDDLDWTQLFGEAILNQQDDVLAAIQQLREQAVANGVIKSDEKVKVVKEQDNIVIQPASQEVIYVPQYEPEMLYQPDYVYQPITYYPDPYPYYWNPGATFFAGAVTGAIWAAAVDWDDGFWGGDWNNGWGGDNDIDIDIECNKCIIGNDFNGKLNVNDVDWTKIDRDKIKIDNDKFQNFDNSKVKDSFKNNNKMTLKDKAKVENKRLDKTARPGKGDIQTKDIRKSTLDKMNDRPVKDSRPNDKTARPGNDIQKPGSNAQKPDIKKPATGNKTAKPAKIDRPVGKPKPAAQMDNRNKTPSPLGEVKRGKTADKHSDRGAKSMGGGMKKPSAGSGGQVKNRPAQKGAGNSGGGNRKRRLK